MLLLNRWWPDCGWGICTQNWLNVLPMCRGEFESRSPCNRIKPNDSALLSNNNYYHFAEYMTTALTLKPLQWRHNERVGVSDHQPTIVYLTVYSKHRWKKTSKLSVTGLRAGNSPVTGEFLAQRACNAANVSIWWRHHDILHLLWQPRLFSTFFYQCNSAFS